MNVAEAILQHVSQTEPQFLERRRELDPAWDVQLRKYHNNPLMPPAVPDNGLMRQPGKIPGVEGFPYPSPSPALPVPPSGGVRSSLPGFMSNPRLDPSSAAEVPAWQAANKPEFPIFPGEYGKQLTADFKKEFVPTPGEGEDLTVYKSLKGLMALAATGSPGGSAGTLAAIKMTPIESSAIAAIGHDPLTKTLAVQYKRDGSIYHYENVSAQKYKGIVDAASSGERLNKNVLLPAAHPYTKATPISSEGGGVKFLDDSQYLYHSTNDENISSIIKEGLRPGTNVGGLTGQPFGEGETVLVFKRGDYRTKSKGYQEDEIVLGGSGKPVAILKDPEPFLKKAVDKDAEYTRLEKAWNDVEQRIHSYGLTLGMDKEAFTKLLDQYSILRERRVRSTAETTQRSQELKTFRNRFGDLADRVEDLRVKRETAWRQMDEVESAPQKDVTKSDVLSKYQQHGLPVHPYKIDYKWFDK